LRTSIERAGSAKLENATAFRSDLDNLERQTSEIIKQKQTELVAVKRELDRVNNLLNENSMQTRHQVAKFDADRH